jgi:propionyl-CoA synthetase
MKFFAASDFGWIVGHSLMVYGSLLRSCASVIFEGKPITPNAGILWKICDNYKINQLFLTPTAVREIVKVDYNGDLIKNYNMKSVNIIHVAGERCDSETMWWLRK